MHKITKNLTMCFCKKILVTLILILVRLLSFSQEYKYDLLVPYRQGELWGYCDTNGIIKIIPKYDSVAFFTTSPTTIVYKNKKQTIINSNGKLLLPFNYDHIYHNKTNNIYVLEKSGLYGLFNSYKKKIVIPVVYDSIQQYKDSLFYIKYKSKKGIVKINGEITINAVYDSFEETHWYNQYKNELNKIIGIKNNRYYLTDLNNNNSIEISKPNDPITLVGEVEKENDESISNNIAIRKDVEEIKNKYQLDSIENMPIPNYYYNFLPFYRIYKSGKVGLWERFTLLIEPSYDNITELKEMRKDTVYIVAVINNRYGIINQKEDKIIPFKYDKLFSLNKTYVIAKTKNKVGAIIFHTVYPPIECLYDNIEYITSLKVSDRWRFTIFKVEKSNKIGYVGENGIEYFK